MGALDRPLPPVVYLIRQLPGGSLVKATIELSPGDQQKFAEARNIDSAPAFLDRVNYHFDRFIRAVGKP